MPLTTEVETGLDELVIAEEGFRFQSLCVVLAKQKWPRLIASEPKYDLGLDAHARADFEPDGRGIGLACSLTAEYDKLAKDAAKVRKNYTDVRVLVFATPGKVTKYTEKRWAAKLKEHFGLDLVVMSRRELVTSLVEPSNADICRSQLRIHIEGKPELQSVLSRAREAVAEVIDSWAQRPRIEVRPLIELDAEKVEEGREPPERLNVDDLRTSLAQGRRIILEAPAGRGKTTTLIQLARRTLDQGGLPFLVDLPIWVRTGTEILQFAARMPAFAKRRLNAQELLELRGAEPFVFLLNGWNEISEGTADSGVQALRELEQNYPSAGIVVATRIHRLRPPLPGAFRAQLLTLARSQRDQYLTLALGRSANELAAGLNNSRTLDELTRTPLFLAEVTELFRKGRSVPTTKMGILSAVMRALEEAEEHAASLQQAPLSGRAREYLSAISMAMTEKGGVEISEADGRAVVNSASSSLEKAGQLREKPEPMTVLNELAKHHVLESINFPTTTFRFQHQQFQEFFAAHALGRQLLGLVRCQDTELEHTFVKRYINEPRWGESLRLFAEDIAARSAEPELVETGALLVRLALQVDPIFAADLARASGPVVWAKVRSGVGKRLRAWYAQKDPHHRQCALAAMLATGSVDFADIFVPLLTDADEQVRLAVYHGAEVLPENLGPNWRDVVRGWPEEARLDFVTELARNPWLADQVEVFALSDPSPQVRWSAAQMLSWHGFTDKVEGLLTAIDDASLRIFLRRAHPNDFPKSLWPRVAALYEQMYNEEVDHFERLRLLQDTRTFDGSNIVERMKAELDGLGPDQLTTGETQGRIRGALEELQKSDPKWVSAWAARKVLDRSLWFGEPSGLITEMSSEEREALFSRFRAELLEDGEQRRIVSILVSVTDPALAARVLTAAREIRAGLTPSPGHDQARWNLFRQIEVLLRAINPAVLLDGVKDRLEKEPDVVELDILTEILPATNLTKPDVRSSISEESRVRLRTYLKRAAKLGADPDGLRANTRAYLARLLANVGEGEDLEDIWRLIEADSARFEKAQAARMKGDHSLDSMGYGFQYLEAVTMVDPAAAVDVIVKLLIGDPQYVYVLPERLPGLARKTTGQEGFGAHRINFEKIWNARAGQPDESFVEERRTRFADAIRDQISRIEHEREAAADKRGFDHRLKLYGGALAALDGKRSAKMILELMERPGRSDGWTRAGALESLLFWGIRLTLEEVLRILEPVMQELRTVGIHGNDHHVSLFVRCLSVMAFAEPPAAGIERIRGLISEVGLRGHELSGVVAALGASRCDDAIDALMVLAGDDGKGAGTIGESWIRAIATLESPRSSKILLSFVDPDSNLFSREFIPDHRDGDILARLLAERAMKDKALKRRLIEIASGDLPRRKRMLLAKVFAHFVDEEDLVDGLCVLRDDGFGLPYELLRSMEDTFLERRPYGTSGFTYKHASRGHNGIRTRLFEMVLSDPLRKESAFGLLGRIELWRLEYGRPADEPRHPVIDVKVPWPPLLS